MFTAVIKLLKEQRFTDDQTTIYLLLCIFLLIRYKLRLLYENKVNSSQMIRTAVTTILSIVNTYHYSCVLPTNTIRLLFISSFF